MSVFRLLVIGSGLNFSSFNECLNLVSCQCFPKIVDNYNEAISALKAFPANCIIVDKNVIDSSELESLYSLGHPQIAFIVVSDKPEDAVDCFREGVIVDFVLKPFKTERIMLAINRALKQSFLHRQHFLGSEFQFFKVGRVFKKINIKDILFIEAYGLYSKLYFESSKVIVNESISKVEERLSPLSFLRVHKSYAVNVEKIIEIGANYINVGLNSIPIGPRYKEVVSNVIGSMA